MRSVVLILICAFGLLALLPQDRQQALAQTDAEQKPVKVITKEIKPFVFVDYAYGKQHSIVVTEEDATAQLADVGFGLQFAHGHEFSGNLMIGFPVLDDFSGTQNDPGRHIYQHSRS